MGKYHDSIPVVELEIRFLDLGRCKIDVLQACRK